MIYTHEVESMCCISKDQSMVLCNDVSEGVAVEEAMI